MSEESLDNEILKEFQLESQTLIVKMNEILEGCEGDYSQVQSLEEYGQNVDRIMGGAQSLALGFSDKNHMIHKIGDYSAICKAVGYKASQIKGNEQFYDICVALLLDGTEVLTTMVSHLDTGKTDLAELFSQTFLDRLRWVSSQFGADVRASVAVKKAPDAKMGQEDIDALLKKLGL